MLARQWVYWFGGLLFIWGCRTSAPVDTSASPDLQTERAQRILADTIYIFYQNDQTKLRVENRQLTHRQYLLPVTSGGAMDTLTYQSIHLDRPLSTEHLLLLKQAIQSGFLQLRDSHGAPDEYPAYTTQITIQLNATQKTVRYRSSPAFEEMPIAFRTLETVLLDLSKSLQE